MYHPHCVVPLLPLTSLPAGCYCLSCPGPYFRLTATAIATALALTTGWLLLPLLLPILPRPLLPADCYCPCYCLSCPGPYFRLTATAAYPAPALTFG